jgi:predicted DNA-binding transcriptional regulator AlpA
VIGTAPTLRLVRGPDTLSPKKLARRLGICVRTLYRWIDRGKIPQPTKLPNRYLLWHVAELPEDLGEHGRKLLLESRPGCYWLAKKRSSASQSAVG